MKNASAAANTTTTTRRIKMKNANQAATTTTAEIMTQVVAKLSVAASAATKHVAILDALDSISKNLYKKGFEPTELLNFLREEQSKLHEGESK